MKRKSITFSSGFGDLKMIYLNIIIAVVIIFVIVIEKYKKNNYERTEKIANFNKMFNRVVDIYDTKGVHINISHLINYADAYTYLKNEKIYKNIMDRWEKCLIIVADELKDGNSSALEHISDRIAEFKKSRPMNDTIAPIEELIDSWDKTMKRTIVKVEFTPNGIGNVNPINHDYALNFINEWHKNMKTGNEYYNKEQYIKACEYFSLKLLDKNIFKIEDVIDVLWHFSTYEPFDEKNYKMIHNIYEYYFNTYCIENKLEVKTVDGILSQIYVMNKAKINKNQIIMDIDTLILYFKNKFERVNIMQEIIRIFKELEYLNEAELKQKVIMKLIDHGISTEDEINNMINFYYYFKM